MTARVTAGPPPLQVGKPRHRPPGPAGLAHRPHEGPTSRFWLMQGIASGVSACEDLLPQWTGGPTSGGYSELQPQGCTGHPYLRGEWGPGPHRKGEQSPSVGQWGFLSIWQGLPEEDGVSAAPPPQHLGENLAPSRHSGALRSGCSRVTTERFQGPGRGGRGGRVLPSPGS